MAGLRLPTYQVHRLISDQLIVFETAGWGSCEGASSGRRPSHTHTHLQRRDEDRCTHLDVSHPRHDPVTNLVGKLKHTATGLGVGVTHRTPATSLGHTCATKLLGGKVVPRFGSRKTSQQPRHGLAEYRRGRTMSSPPQKKNRGESMRSDLQQWPAPTKLLQQSYVFMDVLQKKHTPNLLAMAWRSCVG